ncbi:hypothetical protein AHF37_08109 [Paragonimus kellicotti]|nr:hypothetical protein AHF37_08109 [Paragonimus kellicotti]
MEKLVNFPWTFVHLLISSTALCVGVYVGKTFVIILLLQYLFCKGFQDFNSRSLLLTVTLGAVLLAGFYSFIIAIPTLWNKWMNIVYFFSSTAFLLHYFFFCLLEFSLTKTNPEMFVVFIFSTCPSVACFTLTLFLANWFGIPFCILIPFTGFLTLQWCVSCEHWFITDLKATKSNETLWKWLQDMCIFLLLRAFPLVGYFSEITDSFVHHLLSFTLLYSITEIFTSLLDYTRSTSVRVRSTWQSSAVHHILFGSLFVISFLLVSLRFVDLARPRELQMIFLAIGLFICLLGSSILHIRKPAFSIYRKCSFIFIVLLFFLCLFASSRFPKVANIIPWRGFLPSPFGLTLAICCLCSVVPIALHGCIGDETVHFVIAAFLSAFQLNELYLFQSRLISENLFIGSNMIILACLYS